MNTIKDEQAALGELADRLTGIGVVVCEALADRDGETPADKLARMSAALAEVRARASMEPSAPAQAGDVVRARRVGIVANPGHIMSWNVEDGLGIHCTADRIGKSAAWTVELQVSGRTKLLGYVFGGQYIADAIVRMLRNAATSALLKRRRNKANRAARLAAANLDNEPKV